MITVDFSNTFISTILAYHGWNGENEITEDICRHLALNSILAAKKRYPDHGKVVICCDGFKSWRKKEFAYYKASRKSGREESSLDWDFILGTMNKLIDEFTENLPYKVVKVEAAEADDCIAILVKNYPGPHVVISNDKDFGQLQKYEGVKQYGTRNSAEINIPDAERFLQELIIRGDKGDGVPGIKSDGDTFVTGKRQKSIFQKEVDAWLSGTPIPEEYMEAYKRNQLMIDFDFIPKEISDKIIEEYEKAPVQPKKNLITYFGQNRLKALVEEISTF